MSECAEVNDNFEDMERREKANGSSMTEKDFEKKIEEAASEYLKNLEGGEQK